MQNIGGSKEGAPGTCPRGQNFFIFMQFSAKNLQNNPNLRVGAPSWIRHCKRNCILDVPKKTLDVQ